MSSSVKHPTVYQINTRVWLRKLGHGKLTGLSDVPTEYWGKLKKEGVDYVWLMGIWKTTQSSIAEYCFHPDLQKAYALTNPDWKPEDVGGSPYAIEDYIVDDSIGTIEELQALRTELSKHNIGLILDFIPNHFNAHTSLVEKQPELFIRVDKSKYSQDPYTFYERSDHYFAHGKDPYFPAWTDTVQLNYFDENAHQFMLEKLRQLTEVCDGVRCDMAMLLLPDVLQQTWGYLFRSDPKNFWSTSVKEVKDISPNFLFIAEAYWGKQYELQQLGFDYAYDKATLDHLTSDDIETLSQHLQADLSYQEKLVRFIENHDEQRSLTSLGETRSRAAATIVSTLPGMKLVHDGQWSGLRKKSPVQLTLPPEEHHCLCPLTQDLTNEPAVGCNCQSFFYRRLNTALNDEIIKEGHWHWLSATSPELLAWQMSWKGETVLILVNYSYELIKATVPSIVLKSGQIRFRDILNNQPTDWITHNAQDSSAIDVIMAPFKSAILKIDYKSN